MFASHECAIRIAHETTDFEELCAAYGSAAWGAVQAGDVAEAGRYFEGAIRLARELGGQGPVSDEHEADVLPAEPLSCVEHDSEALGNADAPRIAHREGRAGGPAAV